MDVQTLVYKNSCYVLCIEMRKKKAKPKRKPNLPDNLIYKKKGGRGSKKKVYREEFFKKMKDEDYNPKGKEDFDKLLGEMLKLKGDSLE
jgi:hypothetical protein